MRRYWPVFLLLGIAFIVALHQPGGSSTSVPASTRNCTANDFLISKTKAVVKYDEATLTGIITNQCATSAGVELKWTAFNADGTVAFSSEFWPASTTNIPPHTDYAFEMMNAAPRGKWTYQVSPISTSVW